MYIYVAILIAGLLAGGVGSWRVQEWRYGAKEKERLEAIERDRRIAEKRVDVAAEGHERDKERIRVVTRTVTREVERIVREPFYAAPDAAVCFDADGLRQLTIAARPASATGEPEKPMPGPKPAR